MFMLKHIAAIILLSILIILTMANVQVILNSLLAAHQWISQTLTDVFSGGPAGNLTRQLIALLCLPLLIGLIPVAVYWLAKRSFFPYFMTFVWASWLVEVTALVVMYKTAT
jgi:hypothetical protein